MWSLRLFLFAATVVAFVVGESLLFPNTLLDSLWKFNPEGAGLFHSIGRLSGVFLLSLGVGTFFAALGLRARNRELLLPLILLPLTLPAILMMVQATTGVLTGDLDPIQIRGWITQLAGYDIIYTTVSILLFETVLNAE